MKKFFALYALAIISITGFAQGTATEAAVELPAPVLYQPIFANKALLFFSDEFVWTCKYANEDDFLHKMYDADFSKVKECQCNEETYKLVPSGDAPNGVYASHIYKPVEKGLKANLVSVNDSIMTYTEFSDDGEVKKEVKFKYNLDKVTATDSLYADGQCCKTELTIRKSIKFEKQ